MSEKNNKDPKLPKVIYSLEEEDWIVRNALLHRDIIENKKTDGATKRDKDKAWEKITYAFNVAPPYQRRTMKSLREKYAKIKQNLKNRVFYHAHDAKITGGGPPKKELPPLSEPMQELFSILMPSTVGLSAAIGDSDFESTTPSVPQNHHDDNEVPDATAQSIALIMSEVLNDEEINKNHIGKDINNTTVASNSDDDINKGISDYTWDKVNPAKLRKPKTDLLQNSRRQKKFENEIPNKVLKLSEEIQQLKERKQKIEIEILEGEKERYAFERKRAALDVERAEIERKKAELDLERSAVELQRSKNNLEFDKEIQRVRLAAFHRGTQFGEQPTDPIFLSAAARKEY